jgi:hypothetical protein
MKKNLSDFTKKKTREEQNEDVTLKNKTPNVVERVGVTLRVNREDWERLHYLSIQERTKIQKLLVEGINKVFEARGLEKISDA